jgi:hypothetical protein
MARIKVDKSNRTPRARIPRNPLFLDEVRVGTEPKWDPVEAMEYTDAEFDTQMRASFRYYNYFYSVRELRPEFNSWLSKSDIVDADTLRVYLKSPDSLTPITITALIRAHRAGMPMRDRLIDHIRKTVKNIVHTVYEQQLDTEQREEKKPRAVAKTVGIQDRLKEIADGHVAYVETFEDQLAEGAVAFDAYGYFHEKTATQGAVVAVSKFFRPHFDELVAAAEGRDDQLKEGYRGWTKTKFKQYIEFYTKLFTDIERYQQHKTVVRKPRVKRAPSKEKLVARVKYLKQDSGLKLTSINPADIVGASQLWTFNTRTRKLGVYHADSLQGPLSVKNSTIVGFDAATSVNKTVRKPEETLKEFFRASKPALKKFLSAIKATESKLNGRINEDTVLLKVL